MPSNGTFTSAGTLSASTYIFEVIPNYKGTCSLSLPLSNLEQIVETT